MTHTSYEKLAEKLEKAKDLVEVGAIYRHYRSTKNQYKVLNIALQEATEEICVIYQSSQSSDFIWVRNLNDWLATVKNPDGKLVSRFEKM